MFEISILYMFFGFVFLLGMLALKDLSLFAVSFTYGRNGRKRVGLFV